MKILLAHNYYQTAGGEDIVVSQESAMLRARGHQVIEYFRSNKEIKKLNLRTMLGLPARILWSRESYRQITDIIDKERPDVAHFHNTHFMISPSAFRACRNRDIPIVFTIHNYRLLCPRADFYRGNAICEDCLSKRSQFPGILHKCYHNSSIHTAAVALVNQVHKALGTWRNNVDVIIAPNAFTRDKYLEGHFPSSKILIKPNSLFSDPGFRTTPGQYALYAGRPDVNKGTDELIRAWVLLPEIPLKMVGPGIKDKFLQRNQRTTIPKGISFLGLKLHSETVSLIKNSIFLIVPSTWYEVFPMVIIEAFACGVPVIATRIGGIKNIIDDGRNGLLFNAGDEADLVSKISWAWSHTEEMNRMGREARVDYDMKYSPENDYKNLLSIFDNAIKKNNCSY